MGEGPERRQLSSDERRLTERAVRQLDDDLEWLAYQQKHFELLLDEGLLVNYKRVVADTRFKLESAEKEWKAKRQERDIYREHLVNGVIVKKEEKG